MVSCLLSQTPALSDPDVEDAIAMMECFQPAAPLYQANLFTLDDSSQLPLLGLLFMTTAERASTTAAIGIFDHSLTRPSSLCLPRTQYRRVPDASDGTGAAVARQWFRQFQGVPRLPMGGVGPSSREGACHR